MAQRHARLLAALRPEVLARLVEVRGSIDHAYASIPPDVIRGQFDIVLDKMQSYLVTQDASQYRGFATRWLAMRVGEGFAPENVIHSAVAIGDVIVQVAQARLGQTDECVDFVSNMVHLNFAVTRMLVEILAQDLERRKEQRRQTLAGRGQ
jgi:hypothetical protein